MNKFIATIIIEIVITILTGLISFDHGTKTPDGELTERNSQLMTEVVYWKTKASELPPPDDDSGNPTNPKLEDEFNSVRMELNKANNDISTLNKQLREARDNLTTAENNFSDANREISTLRTQLEEIRNNPPVSIPLADSGYLVDISPAYKSSGAVEYSSKFADGNSFEIDGETYYNGLTLSGEGGASSHKLNKKYTKITGILGYVAKGTDLGYGHLDVYLDDKLVHEIPVTTDMKARQFNIDVTGIAQLRFELESTYATYGYANVTIE
ncbi:hypothetical protein AGMMS49975_10800 [Clostridia bacterium]|nr:hypothetical protein AGMMS49975_10800 [Clostridia bacterium]